MVTRIREESSKHEGGADYHGEEDDDIDDLIQQSIGEICPSRQTSHFSQLHVRLMNAGSVKDVKLSGVPCGSGAWKGANDIEAAQFNSALYTPSVQTAPSVDKAKASAKKNLGKGWFDIEPATMTDDLKRDIKIIQMRNYLDSKRFYKNPDRTGKVLHVGTVVGGFADSKSSRLTRKERKQSILDEVLADKKITKYSKDKYLAIQKEKSNKRKTFKKSTNPKKSW
mmetsp:Transcript_8451/g.14342  ORF Transcript_8451/g.14342 Transcript_8451/m.14342 type:complete len:225 (+) Transcript_8451:94-768(+)|eukprot:CAMPEP_0114423420 /NCGR_PEP_ID=MMETSP0103-20121206/6138_1 /TAXON_ID=37642 ORGANISM="Paraphysomonas imperforata, Strain PA2" /NCGR_SAMPLE_ID=MMETSP0103 /ASSEMBLY_ACC=CAM_ASM_000201 /LENGTH=224 /DNA_ID=CAMNT_0001592079 /DNA_START=58 /DNA_END=732 /DNA_ORIENTATION=-